MNPIQGGKAHEKRFLSLLMALCLMLTPAAFAAEADAAAKPITVTAESDLQNAASAHTTYDLTMVSGGNVLCG